MGSCNNGKKVIVLVGSYPDENSNSSIFVHNQVKSLIKYGYDVRVMHIDLRSIRRLRKFGVYKTTYDGVIVYKGSFPCGAIPSLLKMSGKVMTKKVSNYVKNDWGNVDIIHSHFYGVGRWSNIVKEYLGGKKILTEHSSQILKTNRTDFVFKEAENSYQNQDVLLAVGGQLKEAMEEITSKKISILPNILMSRFNITGTEKYDKFTFISVGNLKKSKRHDLTIRAFSEFKKNYNETKLIIVGDGEEKQSLANLVDELGLEESVDLLGTVKNENLQELYNKSHCFVLPSQYETFGVVYIEALACGLPSIGTRCGGADDIINDENGLLIEVDKEEELIDAMHKIRKNYNNYDIYTISSNIIKMYGEDAFINRIGEIYRGL